MVHMDHATIKPHDLRSYMSGLIGVGSQSVHERMETGSPGECGGPSNGLHNSLPSSRVVFC